MPVLRGKLKPLPRLKSFTLSFSASFLSFFELMSPAEDLRRFEGQGWLGTEGREGEPWGATRTGEPMSWCYTHGAGRACLKSHDAKSTSSGRLERECETPG